MLRRLLLSSAIGLLVIGLAGIALLHFSPVGKVEAVVLNGEPVDQWSQRFGLDAQQPLLMQNLSGTAEQLLRRPGIARVDIDYRLPDKIEIRTNAFSPFCAAVDRHTGVLRALTSAGRVIELPKGDTLARLPLLTNVVLGTLHKKCQDVRVRQLLPRLVQLAAAEPDLFSQIGEIDCSAESYLLVSFPRLRLLAPERYAQPALTDEGTIFSRPDSAMATADSLSDSAAVRVRLTTPMIGVRVSEDQFAEQVTRFYRFYTGILPPLEKGAFFDARFADVVIQIGSDSSLADSATVGSTEDLASIDLQPTPGPERRSQAAPAPARKKGRSARSRHGG